MRYLVTKIPLKDMDKSTFIQIVKKLHHIESPNQQIITKIPEGWVIDDESIIAYDIEDQWRYGYIYNEEEQEVYIQWDKHPSKPIDIIQYLIDHHYIKKDTLYVTDQPLYVRTFEDIIKSPSQLPIIYLHPHTYKNIEFLNTLAKVLKGMAHVVYSDNSQIDNAIEEQFQCQNVIMFLNNEHAKIRSMKNEEDFIQSIFIKVQNYITKRSYGFPYSMNTLYKNALKKMIHLIKENENTAADNLEDQLLQLEEKKMELIERIEKLHAKLTIIKNQNESLSQYIEQNNYYPLVLKGDEKELYEGEQKDMILHILQQELKTVRQPKTIEMIKTILDENPKVGKRDEMLTEIKLRLLKAKQLNNQTIEKLRKCGIEINKSNGNHFEALLFNDSRYMIVIASTPSDMNFNRQFYRDIVKYFF